MGATRKPRNSDSCSSRGDESLHGGAGCDGPSPPVPPDGGWGWVVVFASFMCNVIVDGVAFSFAMFYERFMSRYETDDPRIAWAGSLLSGGYFLMGPVASALMNRYGCRRVTIAGSLIASAGFIGAALSPNVDALIVFYGVMGGLGFGLIYLPAVVIVGYYFEKKRAFATGIALCGSGVGTLLFAPMSDKLLEYYGLFGALLIVSAILLHCAVFGSLFRPLGHGELYRQTYRKERDIPKHRIARGSIFTKIMEDKERQRTISQGSLDGCIITRDNQLIKASNNTMNRLLQQETLASQTMRRLRMSGINHNLSGSGTKLNAPARQNGQAGLQFCTRRGTEPSLSSVGQPNGASPLLSDQSASVTGVFEPGATGSLPITRSGESGVPTTSEWEEGCGGCETKDSMESFRREMARPMYKKDILYSGSMHRVTEFDASPSVHHYRKSTVSVPAEDMASCWDHCPYSQPVVNVLREMLDPCLFKSYTFILLSISSVATMLALFVPYVFIVSMAASLDVPSDSASYLISMIGLCNVFGRIVVGLIADRPWANALCINNLALIIAGVATMMAPLGQTFFHLVVYCCVFGLTIAAFTALRSIVVVELLGLDRLTNAYGLLLLFQGVAHIIGTPVAAIFQKGQDDRTPSLAFYLSGALIIFSGVICLPLRCVANWERRKNGEYTKSDKEFTEVDTVLSSV